MKRLNRLAPALVFLLFVTAVLASLLKGETPRGQVQGLVVAKNSNSPLSKARVVLTNLDDDAPVSVYRTRSDKKGNFLLKGIPAGYYSISASTPAHAGTKQELIISEGSSEPVLLSLKRSRPDLEAAPIQRTYGPAQKILLPLRGYGAANQNLQITLYRARFLDYASNPALSRTLRSVGDRYEPIGPLPTSLLPLAKRIGILQTPLTSVDSEGFFHQNVPLPTQGPGLYLIDASHGNDHSCSYIVVTDLALVGKKGGSELLTYVSHIDSGKAVAGAQVTLFNAQKMQESAITDGSGLARFANVTTDDQNDLIVASLGTSEAILGSISTNNEENGAFTVALYTDRTVYRPGDTLFYKGIARTGASSHYHLPAGQKVTVELRDTQGDKLVSSQLQTNTYGSFWGAATLSGQAPTGFYTLVATINGEEHTQDVQVTAYRKPEMTMTVTPSAPRYTRGDTVTMKVAANYYFGAPVANAGVSYEIYKNVDWRAQDGDEADDDDEAPDDGDTYGQYVGDGQVTLDADGRATLSFSTAPKHMKDDDAAPDANAEIWTVHVTLTDKANRTIEASGLANVSAGDFQLSAEPDGYLALAGTPKNVMIKTMGFDGKPVTAQTVLVSWGFNKGNENSNSSTYQEVGSTQATTNINGEATVAVTVPHGGDLQISVQTKDGSGHTITVVTSVWSSAPGEEDASFVNDQTLELLADKKSYESNETAHVVLNTASPGAFALLTLESNQIYRAWVVPLTGKSTSVNVPLQDEYGPSVTLAACFVHNGAFAQNQIPLRMKVKARQIKVVVTPDKATHLPGETVKYTITTTDAKGSPLSCEYSLSVVDEAIYALVQDDPHLLRDAFYPALYDTVTTNQSLAVEFLGDTNKAAPHVQARRRFVDTAYWQPEGRTDALGHAQVEFKLPDNLTQWRATVRAQSTASAFGYGKAPVVASKPFFVRLDRPRFAVSGDRTQLQGIVSNRTANPVTAYVRLDAPDLKLGSAPTQSLTLQAGQSQTTTWPVTVGTGDASIKLTAWSSDRKLTDAVEETMPVRPFGRDTFDSKAGQMSSGAAKLEFNVAPGATDTQVTLHIVPSVLDAFSGAFNYLLGFPYGCTEQTTSRMMPDLLALQLTKATGRQDFVPAKWKNQLPTMVTDSIVRLDRMQHGGGGWGWWQFDLDSPYLTATVLSGLTTARAQGYAVPDRVINEGAEAALKIAQTHPAGNDLWLQKSWLQNRPFLLLALAQCGHGNQAQAVRKQVRLEELAPPALANLALFDHLTGGNEAAFTALMQRAHSQGQLTWWPGSGSLGNGDDDDLSATALALRALLVYDKNDSRVLPTLRYLMVNRTGSYWESTRDTSIVLQALADYVTAFPNSGKAAGSLLSQLNGKELRTFDLTGSQENLTLTLQRTFLQEGINQLMLKTQGPSQAFYSFEVRQTVPAQNLTSQGTPGLTISREYFRQVLGRPGGWKASLQPAQGELGLGDNVRVRLTITTKAPLSYVLIEDNFVPGCEPTQRGSTDIDDAADWDYWWDATQIRDDRIAFFARSLPAGRHVVEYTLRAQTAGQYRALPAIVQPMYAPNIRADSGETALKIQ